MTVFGVLTKYDESNVLLCYDSLYSVPVKFMNGAQNTNTYNFQDFNA